VSVTIYDLAKHISGRTPLTGADFVEVGLEIIGGCACCHATLAAYNGYPSRSGFWLCKGCLGDTGWDDVEQARKDIFENRGPEEDPT
jgi:hypothetical protein